jgi:hypothetical protein
MRRLLFVVVALAACGHSKASGPAWPEPSKTAEDGGESIAPHPSATYAAVVEKAETVEEAKPTPTAAAPAATSEDKPATTPATTTAPASEEVITTEEIIIEIDD